MSAAELAGVGLLEQGAFQPGEPCPCCGELYEVELLEYFPAERAWIFDTCCEAAHAFLLECLDYAMELSPRERVRYLAPLREVFAEYGLDVRQVFSDGSGAFRLDYGVELRPIDQAEAFAFIDQHHRHNDAPRGWRWGYGLFNGADLVGVCVVGRPNARGWDPDQVVEVSRLCVRDDVPAALVWNACTQAYGEAAREAKRRGFRLVITYTLASEDAHTLKAAGWQLVDPRGVPTAKINTKGALVRGRRWSCASRPRADVAPAGDKLRWARVLRKAPARQAVVA